MATPSKSKKAPVEMSPELATARGGLPIVSIALLALLVLVGVDALYGQFERSNFNEMIQPLLDPADTRVRMHYTGIPQLDGFISFLVVAFLPLTSVDIPEVVVFGIQFFGQHIAAVTILIINGQHQQNAWSIPSFVTLWCMIMQAVGFAVGIPIYFIIDLLTSPTTDLVALREPFKLQVIIPAFVLAYIIPTVLMFLPFDDYLHQSLIAFWQPYPILLSFLLYLFAEMSKLFSPWGSNPAGKTASDREVVNHAYSFAIWTAAVSHWLAIGTIIAAGVCPGLFPAGVAEKLSFRNVFIPWPIHYYGPATASDVMKQFLQYDMYVGSLACLTWSVTKAARAGVWEFSPGNVLSLVKDVVILGPVSAALSLLQMRDESIYASTQ